ncbi:MAG: GDSL-type esterase/lipase family protein [Candidatus Marsarchaeota archaeon]|nr:GDSL-type esterase/lipase family protein [Candidatus Marsarchaeota archaeon]MCL5102028.1 GDSL-type esterase/lipase family protein [Candidatus Marsarchaeota archaeon]
MNVILCFGDSITFGRGHDGGWCGHLKRWFEGLEKGNVVYNLGIKGDTSAGLLKRFGTEARARIKPSSKDDKYTLLIAIGTNDSKYSDSTGNKVLTTEARFERNISSLVKKAKAFGQKIAFIGLPPVDNSKPFVPSTNGTVFNNERVTKFNNIIRDCCSKEHIPFLNINNIAKKNNIQLEDGRHPNANGYLVMFREIRKFLEENSLVPD